MFAPIAKVEFAARFVPNPSACVFQPANTYSDRTKLPVLAFTVTIDPVTYGLKESVGTEPPVLEFPLYVIV